MKLTAEEIAQVAHEANRAYCHSIGDFSQLAWKFVKPEGKAVTIDGVNFHLKNPDASSRASHENWMKAKSTQGWTYGETKNDQAKTHPSMVPYESLSHEQRTKDIIFSAMVATLKGL